MSASSVFPRGVHSMRSTPPTLLVLVVGSAGMVHRMLFVAEDAWSDEDEADAMRFLDRVDPAQPALRVLP